MPDLSKFEIKAELFRLCIRSIIFISKRTELLPQAYLSFSCGILTKPYDQDTFDRIVIFATIKKAEAHCFTYIFKKLTLSKPCRDILLFRIRNYVLTMHCTNGDLIRLTNKNLDAVERELSEVGFFRCCRSTLVNLRYYSSRKDNHLVNGNFKYSESIMISRRRIKEYDKQTVIYKMNNYDVTDHIQ